MEIDSISVAEALLSIFARVGIPREILTDQDLWEDRNLKDDDQSAFRYVVELQEKLAETAQIAANNADISASKYKTYFDIKSQDRQFQPGDEVLLLPSDSSKLLVTWKGPYTVLERRGKVDYLID
ncbi:uncharacterized protein LOC123510194 [Portunus trituberculatus]|uniref:uncharacterized protein LOC123510194 n=1 Tax=Portunus trituberculatus TaxID=210409 RepID=UPI001E1D1438|nr:uncharacterized protein LOC123510194 [Portunus trituberculatus]